MSHNILYPNATSYISPYIYQMYHHTSITCTITCTTILTNRNKYTIIDGVERSIYMFIRIKLPNKYGDLQIIKEENYPFNRAFREFMLSVIQLSAREGEDLSPYAAFGRIEHALVSGESLELSGEDSASIDYREDDATIVDFYKSSGYRQKEMTLMFIKLLMKLCSKYGNSIPEIIYLITNIDSDATVSSAEPIKSERSEPIVHIRKSTTPRPTPKPTPKPTRRPNNSANVDSSDKSSAGDILARATKLKQDADELSAGTTVTANPLLNDFFDI